MKLSDIFSLNLNSKGGAKLFKKIANKYNLDYKKTRKSVEENTNKYGYYKLNKDIIPDSFGTEEFCAFLSLLLECTKHIELNGVTSFDRLTGPCGFINTDARYAIKIAQNDSAEFPYIGGEYFNPGLKICENDITYISAKNQKYYTHVISGTISERINSYSELIPITKEEYEHLSDELKNIEVI